MNADNHLPRLAAMVDQLGASAAGLAAAAKLAEPTLPTEQGYIAVLPSWAWIVPKIDVGRKGRTTDGELLTMPVRITYPAGELLVFEAEGEYVVPAHVTGLGWDEDIETTVRISADAGVQAIPTLGEEMSPVVRQYASHRMYQRILRGLISHGTTARWELITSLEVFIRNELAVANTTVAAEIGAHRNHGIANVVDEIGIEELLGKLLYGENGSSVISRMVDRALLPGTFMRVDPMRWFAVNVRARAEEAVRAHIGDPKVGPKVRRVFKLSGAKTIDELVAAYRDLYPRDSLARKRAIAALSAGPSVAAFQREFEEARLKSASVSIYGIADERLRDALEAERHDEEVTAP